MSTSTLNIRLSQFPYDSYTDYVRTQHGDHLSDSGANNANAYWLYDAFHPYLVLPFEHLGVSILELVNGHINLGWSSSFEMPANELTVLSTDLSTRNTAAAELLERIDNGTAAIDFRVAVVHCFPRKHQHGSQSSECLPQDPAWGDILDAVGVSFKLEPNFFVEHLAGSMPEHTALWQSLRSERGFVYLKRPGGGHITFTLRSASVSSPQIGQHLILRTKLTPSSIACYECYHTYNMERFRRTCIATMNVQKLRHAFPGRFLATPGDTANIVSPISTCAPESKTV